MQGLRVQASNIKGGQNAHQVPHSNTALQHMYTQASNLQSQLRPTHNEEFGQIGVASVYEKC